MIFFKKLKPLYLKTDIHSHLLPGIDDGVKSLDESIEIIKKFISLGYKKLIITPHVMEDTYNNSTEIILNKFKELQNAVKNLDIELDISAEYYADSEFLKRIETGDLLSINDKYLLFETSYYEKPINLEEIVFKIQTKGLTPVLAHPERYRYIEDLDDYKKLKDLGVLFQCNINSFGGFYGKNVQKKVKYLAKQHMIDFLGSDCHSMKYMDLLEKVIKNKNFIKLIEKNSIKNNSI